MQDLKDVTSHTHYENYRTGKLTEMMKNGEVTKNAYFSITLSNKEEGNALTAVGDEIRSRITASKKDGKGERPVENKKVKLEQPTPYLIITKHAVYPGEGGHTG